MKNVYAFVPAIFPPRRPNVSVHTPLVSLFKAEPDLLPFVRFLFNEHEIFTVGQWDEASSGLIDQFDLGEAAKAKFRRKVGRPAGSAPADAAVIKLALRHVR